LIYSVVRELVVLITVDFTAMEELTLMTRKYLKKSATYIPRPLSSLSTLGRPFPCLSTLGHPVIPMASRSNFYIARDRQSSNTTARID